MATTHKAEFQKNRTEKTLLKSFYEASALKSLTIADK